MSITSKIIHHHSGIQNNFTGDGIMALYGFQSKCPHNAAHGAICAADAEKNIQQQYI
jgi:hypothetical protein